MSDYTDRINYITYKKKISYQYLNELAANDDYLLGIASNNLLINPQFLFMDRAATIDATTLYPNSNDNYIANNWYLLSDGNDVVDIIQTTTDTPSNTPSALRLQVETANKKFGIAQIIEGDISKIGINNYISLAFEAKTISAKEIGNIRAAVVSWSSTKDTVTSSIVAAWGIAGANPTLIANCTYENVASNLALTTAFQTFKIENILVDTASAANLIVFIWSDDTTTTVDDEIVISNVRLIPEVVAPSVFTPRHYSIERRLCDRYFEVLEASAVYGSFGAGGTFSTTAAYIVIPFTEKRALAGFTVNAGTDFALETGNATFPVAGLAVTASGKKSLEVAVSGAVGMTANYPAILVSNNNTTAKIFLNADM